MIPFTLMELETWRSERKKVNIQPGRLREQEKVQVPGAMAKAELLEHSQENRKIQPRIKVYPLFYTLISLLTIPYTKWKKIFLIGNAKKYTLKEKILGQTVYRDKVYKIFIFIKLLELDLNYICAILVIAYTWMSKFTFSHVVH